MILFVQEAAETDILQQIEWYAERGLPQIAHRFPVAVKEAIQSLYAMPEAGSTKHIANPRLAGLRSWPVKGFPSTKVYYLASPEMVTIVRILHGKRDVSVLMKDQEIEQML